MFVFEELEKKSYNKKKTVQLLDVFQTSQLLKNTELKCSIEMFVNNGMSYGEFYDTDRKSFEVVTSWQNNVLKQHSYRKKMYMFYTFLNVKNYVL